MFTITTEFTEATEVDFLALPECSLVDVRDVSESDFSVLSVSPVVDVANEVDFSVLSVCSVVDV